MSQKLDWNRERYRTRDLLLEYDYNIMPAHPRAAGLPIIYPWENQSLSVISYQLYEIAKNYGFPGTVDEFFSKFSLYGGNIIKGTVNTFPIPGNENNLYFDEESEILYYFSAKNMEILSETAAKIGAAIVGYSVVKDTQEIITYLYIPVKASLVADTILDSGDASEYID